MTDQSPPAWKADADELGDATNAFIRKHLAGNRMAELDLLLLVHLASDKGWWRCFRMIEELRDAECEGVR